MEFRKWELNEELKEAEEEMSFYDNKVDSLQKDLDEALRMVLYWSEVIGEVLVDISELEDV